MLLAVKLVLTPFFIGLVTLAGRRWGPVLSGLLMGLPLTSGPVSIFLAYQYGPACAARAAIGNMVGEAAVCVFCLVYSLAAQKKHWPISVLAGASAFLAGIFLCNLASWTLPAAFAALLAVILLVSRLIPRCASAPAAVTPPRWDLPARMTAATLFVLLLTTFAQTLGAQMSGLLAPFPVFGLVLAAFTHQQQGARAAASMLRSVVLGSVSFAVFFLIVGLALTHLGMFWTYWLAAAAAVLTSAIYYLITRRRPHLEQSAY